MTRIGVTYRRSDPLASRASPTYSVGSLVDLARAYLAVSDPAGAQIVVREAEEIVRRTEGWPVGLYLAALAVKAGGSHDYVGVTFSGDDRFMSDYLRSEFLDRLTEDVGGENNAFTSDDMTVYHEVVPSNHLERLLWAEAERLGVPLVFQSPSEPVRSMLDLTGLTDEVCSQEVSSA